MSFVDPGDFAALQIVDENDLNTIADDLVYLAARVVPVGSVQGFAGSAAPTGYLLCDGSAVSRATYAALYAITGDQYGAGNGSTTFNLPDFRQRFPMGKAASGTGSTLGSSGGSKDQSVTIHSHTQDPHTHTQNQHSHGNDAHDHPVDDNDAGGHTHDSTSGVTNVVQAAAGPYNVGGSGNSWVTFDVGHIFRTSNDGTHNHNINADPSTITIHNQTATNQNATATNQNSGISGTDQNLPPYQVLNYIIKY